jgi:hypothetical protein
MRATWHTSKHFAWAYLPILTIPAWIQGDPDSILIPEALRRMSETSSGKIKYFLNYSKVL